MLNKILKLFFSLFFILFIIIISLVIINYFDFPFSKYNFIFSILAIMMMRKTDGKIIWFAFFIFFIFDLFSANDFGIIFFSGTVATLFIFWFFKELFSKQSVWSLVLMVLLFILIYNFLYLFILNIFNLFSQKLIINYSDFFYNMFFEIIITSIITFFLYGIIDYLFKKIDKSYKLI